jgi:monolysocardiolipin acyltransferase
VIVVVGDPISFDDLQPDKIEATDPEKRGMLYDIVSLRIGLKLQELKTQADKLALERPLSIYVQNRDNSHAVWQHVDWELFGMDYMLKSSDEASVIDDKTEDVKQIDRQHVPLEESNTFLSVKNHFCYGGILSRVRGYMNPSELMGFAARGLFVNGSFFGGEI